jgi:soluble lytic murein transglycosylase-like protein
MRYSNLAGGASFAGRSFRLGLLLVAVAALQLFAIAGPALARSHVHAHRFVARRHVTATRINDFIPAFPNFFGPFATKQETTAREISRRNRSSRSNWNQNNWSQNSWHQNGWEQSAFEQNNWHRGGYTQSSPLDGMAAQQASAAGVPVSLVERVIKRESGGNPRAVSRGNYGLMQIRLGTARAMGYSGSASGLLAPATNMTYAVRYLAGAYRAAGGNENRAVALYARGYYDVAKAQGFTPYDSPSGALYDTSTNSPSSAVYRPVAFQTMEEPFGSHGLLHRPWRHRRRAV